LCPTNVAADPYPASVDLYVNDLAGLIEDGDETALRSDLSALFADTGVEMTVLTIGSRREYDPSPSLEAFATGLFNSWGVGHPERNNGILLLVVRDDREIRVELGAGYNQGYDVYAADIIGRMTPAFRAGDFSGGIVRATGE